jgi:hypothetical protein
MFNITHDIVPTFDWTWQSGVQANFPFPCHVSFLLLALPIDVCCCNYKFVLSIGWNIMKSLNNMNLFVLDKNSHARKNFQKNVKKKGIVKRSSTMINSLPS